MEAHSTETVETQIASIRLIESDILEIEIAKDAEIEKSDAQEIIDISEKLGEGRKLKHLFLYGMRALPSQEARALFCSEMGSHFKSAEAIVVLTLSQRMVFNFMINVEKTVRPTKLFTTREDAKNWLQLL